MHVNLLFCLLVSIHLSAFAQHTKTPIDHIANGDEAYSIFDNQAALSEYQIALDLDSLNYEAAWKLTRAYVDIGESLKDKKQRKFHFQEAAKYSRRIIRINPDRIAGHLFLSIALGRIALDAGAKERVKLAKEIKEEADRALELDPLNNFAWHVLGLWNREVASIGWLQKFFANLIYRGIPNLAKPEPNR